MTDTRNPYCATKRQHLTLVERTEPKPGDVLMMRHGAYRVNDRGGYEPARVASPITPPTTIAPTPWTVLHGRGWEALGGVALGAVFVVVAVLLLAVGR